MLLPRLAPRPRIAATDSGSRYVEMRSSIDSGGLTHVRYAHGSRPTRIDVACPACGELAVSRLQNSEELAAVLGDLHPAWRVGGFDTTCLSCPNRLRSVTLEQLPPLYWRFDVGDLSVWAWNRDHLTFLLRLLSGEECRDNPYAWLETYVPGAWKSKRNAPRVARAIRRIIDADRVPNAALTI